MRIVRTGGCLRMVLHCEKRHRLVAHPFDALIVEIDVRYFDFGRQAVSEHRKAVIVRSDLDVAVLKSFTG